MLQIVKVPIACTLLPADASSQLRDWREMLPRLTSRSERISPNRLEHTLSPDADIRALLNLAQREAACCSFFSFSIEIQPDRLVLAVKVPDDAIEILDGLVADWAT